MLCLRQTTIVRSRGALLGMMLTPPRLASSLVAVLDDLLTSNRNNPTWCSSLLSTASEAARAARRGATRTIHSSRLQLVLLQQQKHHHHHHHHHVHHHSRQSTTSYSNTILPSASCPHVICSTCNTTTILRSFGTSQKKYRNRKRNQPPAHVLNRTSAASKTKDETAAATTSAATATTSSSKKKRPTSSVPSKSGKSNNTSFRIEARPAGEAEYHPKIPLPDQAKEKELGQLQNAVQEYYRAGNYTKGLQAAQELLKATRDHFGSDHPATAAAYNNTGLLHKQLGDFVKARADYQAAQRIYKNSALGVDHTSYATALHNLGNLNRNQIHLDGDLSATDRLCLVEDALEYLQQAHAVRLAEFGPHHPHTVSSRSAWGATLAVQILHRHKLTETAAREGNLQKQRFYVSLLPSDLTLEAWEAAHDHLRAALATAVRHPRGTTVQQALEQRRQRNSSGSSSSSSDNGALSESQERAARESPLPTLSAAAAAQNLAVFFKTRATTTTTTTAPHREEWLHDAERLYRQVLTVQAVLLHETHPDVYATKHSLAELYGAMGDEDAAQALRQEIVDSYDPPSSDDAAATAATTAEEGAAGPSDQESNNNDDDAGDAAGNEAAPHSGSESTAAVKG